MRNSTLVFLLAAALVLAKSGSGPGPVVEVHSSNAGIEVVGGEGEQVTVNESSHATVRNQEGRVVVEAEGPLEGGSMHVQAPRGASLEIVTSNGSIRVAGVMGTLQLRTSNGAITVQDAGSQEIHALTSNGRIEVGVARGLNADVSARTSNGRIHCDVEMVTRHVGANFLEGKIGSGGATIDLQTSNGAIYLKHAGDQEKVVSTFKPGEVK